MTKYRLRFLYQHYQAGTLTNLEHLEWKTLLADPNLKGSLEEIIDEGWYDFSEQEMSVMDPSHANQIFDRIVATPQQKAKPTFLWKPIAVAASILLIAALSVVFFTRMPSDNRGAYVKHTTHIKPGGNKAYLTLGNGKRIILTDLENGTLSTQNGLQITKTHDGQLVYTITGDQPSGGNDYNVIETPRGGQYQILLPDGTHVWLNAASSLKYPSVFTGKERKVELQGEAYFEVSKNKKMPFKVISSQQTVEVLGTHFNVNSYAEDKEARTTLLEGSVRVEPNHSAGIMIRPGQQTRVKLNDKINVIEADLEEVMAWKDNYFRFNNEKIESIMRKISRWYDVGVEYHGPISEEEFNGTISRAKNISQVLEMLEDTKSVHFKIEGRRIIVMK
ncbi:FecR family protein [Pedobacter gandavensis]|uniref:FecR family protein n=1 Tax=Pedobacter gandavensis TaxID=2679963 RepID=UPI002479B957|nr:FecR family protein [Pedobacter gandavensis]WGQ11191.1 FecR family protein [Pedobacter gandavensis]